VDIICAIHLIEIALEGFDV